MENGIVHAAIPIGPGRSAALCGVVSDSLSASIARITCLVCKELIQVKADQGSSGESVESAPPTVDTLHERLLQELRWYGKTIAGGVPMIGSARPAREACDRWYLITLPLLSRLNAIYGDLTMIGCLACHGRGFAADKVCSTCGGIGMVTAASSVSDAPLRGDTVASSLPAETKHDPHCDCGICAYCNGQEDVYGNPTSPSAPSSEGDNGDF